MYCLENLLVHKHNRCRKSNNRYAIAFYEDLEYICLQMAIYSEATIPK